MERRNRSRLAVHRCLNGPSPKALQGLFVRNKEMGYNNTRGAEKLHIFTNQTDGVGGHLQLGGMGVESPA